MQGDSRLRLHPDIRIKRLTIGAEQAPLLVIDNFVANAEELVTHVASKQFARFARYFPGVRTKASLAYQHLFASELKNTLREFFQIEGRSVGFTMCHYSLVTTPAKDLEMLQRIPHVDSTASEGLATIHYLFKKDLGGTAFYRHRQTGFEIINSARMDTYLKVLQQELDGPNAPHAEYINGDTPLFQQVASQEGVFNRMLIYRRNSLHCGCIHPDFQPDPNPATGRLSINSFVDFT